MRLRLKYLLGSIKMGVWGKSLAPIIALAVSGLTPVAAQDTGKAGVAELAKTGRVATEVFGRRPFMRSPTLSPDGTKIAVMMSNQGVDYLGIIDLAKPGAAPNFFIKAEEFREVGDRTVDSWRWAGNRTVVVTLLSREDLYGQRVDLRRLVTYDLETGKTAPLAWEGTSADGGDIKHIDHKKETLVLQRTAFRNDQQVFDPEVIEVSVRTGKFETLMRPNIIVDDWIVDGKGVVRAGVGFDEDNGKQRLLYRSDASGPVKTVANQADTTFTGAQILPSVFLDEPDMAYATTNKDNFRRVYKVNLKTMEIVGKPVFEAKGYDVEGIIPNEAGNDMLGVAVVEKRSVRYWFNNDFKALQGFLDEDYGKGNAQIVSTDMSDNKFIIQIGKPSQPGSYRLYDVATGNLRMLGWYHPVLKDAELNPMESIRYKASDGLEIEAVVTYPRHRSSRKNLPVVVMPHGGPFGIRQQEEFGPFPWHQALAEMGYLVIEPNYRGSGGYGREFVMEGRKPNGYGVRMQDDLNDAVSWFAQKGMADANRACIMGWSYGGYAAARGAQRDPSVWKCAIAGAGIYDFPMMKAFDTRQFGAFGANFQATADNLVAISSARNTDGKWSPILIVAGKRDARIPLEQSRTLVSRLKASGKKEDVDFRYVEQAKGTHNLPYEDVHIEWLTEAEKWLGRFNPAYIDSDAEKAVPVTVVSK
jgi:dipeptidyl aminopeptidase/acylaminoacyl peptidase